MLLDLLETCCNAAGFCPLLGKPALSQRGKGDSSDVFTCRILSGRMADFYGISVNRVFFLTLLSLYKIHSRTVGEEAPSTPIVQWNEWYTWPTSLTSGLLTLHVFFLKKYLIIWLRWVLVSAHHCQILHSSL